MIFIVNINSTCVCKGLSIVVQLDFTDKTRNCLYSVTCQIMERKSLFGAQSRCWTPLENEFLAENEMIEIIPNFSCPKRNFIQVFFYIKYIYIYIGIQLQLAIG